MNNDQDCKYIDKADDTTKSMLKMRKKLGKLYKKSHQHFYCKLCDYTAKRKCDIEKHFETKKHKDKILRKSTEPIWKNAQDETTCHFICILCNFMTPRKLDYDRHMSSKKHKNMLEKEKCYVCECGKVYKHLSSLSRHRNICTSGTYTNKLVSVLEENNKLQEQIIEMQKEVIESGSMVNAVIGDAVIGNTVINNTSNKIINIQMFLNEECANAMSIQNFTQDLTITVDDLDKNKQDCITNVVLKSLRPLTAKERPFHCKNVKKQEWYIKDENDGWEEDNGEKVIQSTENGIIKKWAKEFENKYPEWMKNEGLQEKYCKIAGSTSSELPEKLKIKLLAELGEEVLIDDI